MLELKRSGVWPGSCLRINVAVRLSVRWARRDVVRQQVHLNRIVPISCSIFDVTATPIDPSIETTVANEILSSDEQRNPAATRHRGNGKPEPSVLRVRFWRRQKESRDCCRAAPEKDHEDERSQLKAECRLDERCPRCEVHPESPPFARAEGLEAPPRAAPGSPDRAQRVPEQPVPDWPSTGPSDTGSSKHAAPSGASGSGCHSVRRAAASLSGRVVALQRC